MISIYGEPFKFYSFFFFFPFRPVSSRRRRRRRQREATKRVDSVRRNVNNCSRETFRKNEECSGDEPSSFFGDSNPSQIISENDQIFSNS